MSKFLLNLLPQFSKALVNSKIQFLIQKFFSFTSGPFGPAASRPTQPLGPRRHPASVSLVRPIGPRRHPASVSLVRPVGAHRHPASVPSPGPAGPPGRSSPSSRCSRHRSPLRAAMTSSRHGCRNLPHVPLSLLRPRAASFRAPERPEPKLW
jgi:hypothetical protein